MGIIKVHGNFSFWCPLSLIVFSSTLHSSAQMGTRKAGKPKPKSIKSKSINKNSKRKLATLGKKLKKGYAGEAIMYITRAQAIRRLDLSLKDFRFVVVISSY